MKEIRMFARAWKLCGPFHRSILAILAMILGYQGIGALLPIVFGLMVSSVTEHDDKKFIEAVGLWTALILFRSFVVWFRERFELSRLDFVLAQHLSRVSLRKFFDISMGQHHIGHSAIKRSVVHKGEAAVSGVVYMVIYEVLPISLMIVLPSALTLAKAPSVGALVIVSIIGFAWYTIRYNSSFVPQLRKLDTLSNDVGRKQSEVISNADTVFVNAQELRVQHECDNEKRSQGTQERDVWLRYLTWFYFGQKGMLLAQAVTVGLSGWLVYIGEIDTGSFVTIFMWIGSALGSLNNISHIQRNLAKNIAPITKYFEFLDYENEVKNPERPLPIGNMLGEIEFRDVRFAYQPRANKDAFDEGEEPSDVVTRPKIPAIRGISFKLHAGRRYAFVGTSGAGKSTMVNLILRAYDPQDGHILIDGIDIRMLDYRELRRNIGLVPQEVQLFDGTVLHNVTFGLNGEAVKVTPEELENVAKLSRMSEFTHILEKGWETTIGERGIKLSGGQKQRLGIARALIKSPRILIFDEATSSLDTENEAKIRDSIRDASVGKTTIIIAHRLATVRDADEILVFDNGRIVGQGTHATLLETNDYYQRLVQNQVILK